MKYERGFFVEGRFMKYERGFFVEGRQTLLWNFKL